MEAALVGVVVKKLGDMAMERISEEASLVLNFRKEFEWLKKKLTYISSYLKEADLQGAHDTSVKSWLLEVADIAFDAEDILDECGLQSEGTVDESPQSSCFCAFNYSQLGFRHKMARRIKDVKYRMRSIVRDGKELNLFRDLARSDQPSTSTLQNVNLRGTSLMEIGSKPVAIEPKVEEVVRLLGDPSAPVIAVVGMGGVGKTFLMQNVFNRVKDKYEKSVWLSISQTYSLRKLQADMASELQLNSVISGQVSEVQAAKLIHDHLASTRCLIVLDDVWRAAGEYNTLAQLISALGIPLGNNRHCKIVVTTRSRDVGTSLKARVYELQPLSEEESWNLFCAFAFPDCHLNQPPHQLEGLSRQVERECGRLPLAVKTVAASLAGEISSREWESKLGQVREVSYSEDPIMHILKLSYDSLPPHLKPCFAYLSFFPEDCEIDYQYLINLWAAEGYVSQGEEQLDIGWKYICHLQSLCLVERVGNTCDIYDHNNRRFKVHDLLLDLGISISKESECVVSAEEALKKDTTVQGRSRYRRILMAKKSIGDGDVNVLASNRAYPASRLRTLSFSLNEGIENIPAILLSSARVLRVLDLSGTHISSLPDCLGNLKLLRVLNLRETQISEVPECVKRNKSLRFLDVCECPNLERLPEWIGELNCLEHLDIRPSFQKKYDGWMPKGISKLVSLQVLLLGQDNKQSVEENEFLRVEHFVNLVNFREVRINVCHVAELKSIEDWILAALVKMRTLTLVNSVEGHVDEGNLPSLSQNMLAMKDLEYLYLGKFAVPNWISGFSNLKQLSLWGCHCIEHPALEVMPNLIMLELNHNFICKALPKGFGKPGGFLQLRYFDIFSFSVLEELPELEDGAMPHLEILIVYQCYDLKKAPVGLEFLKSLKECTFGGTGVDDMFEEGSELWNKIKANNPNVRIILE